MAKIPGKPGLIDELPLISAAHAIKSSTLGNSTPDNSTPDNSTLDNSTLGNSTLGNGTLDNGTLDNNTPGNGIISIIRKKPHGKEAKRSLIGKKHSGKTASYKTVLQRLQSRK